MCGVYQKMGEIFMKPYADGIKMGRESMAKEMAQANTQTTSPNYSMPQSSANSFMPAYSDQQQPMAQQQVQPASMPRATTNRFSFNRGSLRIGDSTMNASDTGLNV